MAPEQYAAVANQRPKDWTQDPRGTDLLLTSAGNVTYSSTNTPATYTNAALVKQPIR